MTQPSTIAVTPETLTRLKQAYANCETETFVFEGREILKAYAKYMIEHLENQFNSKGRKKR